MEFKFYEDQTGRVPVKEFLDGLDIKMRQKCFVRFRPCRIWVFLFECRCQNRWRMAFLSFAQNQAQISAVLCISSLLEIERS